MPSLSRTAKLSKAPKDYAVGKLVLVPTPLDQGGKLHPVPLELLGEQWTRPEVIICVEELKVARRRWVGWGLPREALEVLYPFNEHNQQSCEEELLGHLRKGGVVYLMSDGGLPAFCDPGQQLVGRCHDEGILVTATPFEHSVALALAMSGFPSQRYVFEGFPPRSTPNRRRFFKELSPRRELIVLMDTPYRLHKVLEEVAAVMPQRVVFLACDLGRESEVCQRGTAGEILFQYRGSVRETLFFVSALIRAGWPHCRRDLRPLPVLQAFVVYPVFGFED